MNRYVRLTSLKKLPKWVLTWYWWVLTWDWWVLAYRSRKRSVQSSSLRQSTGRHVKESSRRFRRSDTRVRSLMRTLGNKIRLVYLTSEPAPIILWMLNWDIYILIQYWMALWLCSFDIETTFPFSQVLVNRGYMCVNFMLSNAMNFFSVLTYHF